MSKSLLLKSKMTRIGLGVLASWCISSLISCTGSSVQVELGAKKAVSMTQSDAIEINGYLYSEQSPSIFVGQSLALTGRCMAGSSAVVVELFSLSGNGGSEVAVNCDSDGAWSLRQFDLTQFSDGNVKIKVTHKLPTKNVVSPEVKFTKDTQRPVVNAGSDFTVLDTGTPQASAQDDGSGIASYTWSKTSGDGVITYLPSNLILTPKVSNDTIGAVTLTLTVTDKAGNSSSDSVLFTKRSPMSIFPLARLKTNSRYLENDSTPEIRVKSGEPGDALELHANDSCSSKILDGTVGQDGTANLTPDLLNAGTFKFSVKNVSRNQCSNSITYNYAPVKKKVVAIFKTSTAFAGLREDPKKHLQRYVKMAQW